MLAQTTTDSASSDRSSIDGVRTVAGIFLIIGWIMLVVGGLSALAILASIGSTTGGIFGAMVPLGIAFGMSLSPFFLWAILRALIEIYEVQYVTQIRMFELLDISRTTMQFQRINLLTLQSATGIYDAADAPRPQGRTAKARASGPGGGGTGAAARDEAASTSRPTDESGSCPGCGWRNTAGERSCQQCGVTI